MPRLRKLEVEGFRSFGEPCELEFSGPCAVISGANSQGKTSLAEALEFLFTGSTVRRELIGGAKAEFSGSLRNVYRPIDSEVWVQATLEDDEGNPHVVRRVLDSDYTANEDCSSTLTVDGVPHEDLSSLGIHLATPPLRAPVLLQHSLRFALSAKPSDRSEYFKAVVSVSDLERFRDAVADLDIPEPNPPERPIQLLDLCGRHDVLSQMSDEIALASDQAAVDEKLRQSIEQALLESGTPEAEIPGRFDESFALLQSRVTEARGQHFAVAELATPGIDRPVPAQPFAPDSLEEFISARDSAGIEATRMERIFEAVLAVPDIDHAHDAKDCPVCETPGALSPTRIKVMRDQIESNSRLGQLRASAGQLVGAAARWLESQGLESGSQFPIAVSWNEDRWNEAKAQMTALGVADTQVDQLREPVRSAQEAIDGFRASHEEAGAELRREQNSLDNITNEQAREIFDVLETVRANRAEAISTIKNLMEVLDPVAAQLKEAIDRSEGFGPSADLLNLAGARADLLGAIQRRSARQEAREELSQAVAQIDEAKGLIFDRRFEEISSEIEEWWELLRPEEHVQFGGVRRRGTGRRYIDFKARLHVEVGGEHFERDAIGVLSDSQLNALGLAAFLARCQKQGNPIVVLDEPVQAGDDEHRVTFARFAIERLLDAGIQVIVCSFDRRLVKVMADLYRDHPLDSFSASLSERARGTEVVKTSNPILTALLDAQIFSRHDDETIRAEGTRKMRPAAEALAKEIILQGRRENGETCDLSEYEGIVLGDLLPTLEPYLSDNGERGKWRAAKTVLNPGHHDDEVPARTALMTTAGDLIKSLKDHGLA